MKICVLFLWIVLHTKCLALKSIHLTIVVCGDRLDEALTSLKSSLIFTPGPLIFHIFTEDHLREEFREKIDFQWPLEYKSKFQIEFYSIQFTRGNDERWKALFKPCCTQRLFIPDILKHIDSVVYTDTDTLFLTNVRNLWRHFRKFNTTQLAALTPEHEDLSKGWYNQYASHPYYGSMGLNSGVMLMNLTRMREVDMISKLMNIFDEFHLYIRYGDQCLLNIYFHSYPEQMYELTCDWNYRPDHCIFENNCAAAKDHGIQIVHGSRNVFHTDQFKEFKAIYEVIHRWKFDSNLKSSLLSEIRTKLRPFSRTNCGKTSHLFTKHLSKEVLSLTSSLKKTFHLAFIVNQNWNSIEQLSITLKSLSFFSSNQSQRHLHILTTDLQVKQFLSQQIESIGYSITYYNTTIEHPFHLWKIINIDRVVYFNSNIIFTNSLEKIWALFNNFNFEQAIGMFGQCHISASMNMLLLDLNQMRKLNVIFDGMKQIPTKNVYFIPCEYILDPDHCQSIPNALFLSNSIDERLFRVLYKLINQIDLQKTNDLIVNEINSIDNLPCRSELAELFSTNKQK
ncbi:unnamed protein product [Adineta ricciae]|uniref:UDP-D-xylose:beta-D-glucoside alpha-1,3-D-xylosyltransferase n=1 Tax=Adineta ricciae TaxID=249248 RepID=A0A815TWT8_ADIRI|nr:unnamed protein product [Adineta ricciae]CAF1622583.1 unnamed protein product [Adineta ricciae]